MFEHRYSIYGLNILNMGLLIFPLFSGFSQTISITPYNGCFCVHQVSTFIPVYTVDTYHTLHLCEFVCGGSGECYLWAVFAGSF